MKLLMLGWELPPHNSGGLGVACFQMAKALADEGANIDFILPYQADHPEADKFMHVEAATDLPPAVDRDGNYTAMGAYDAGTCTICGKHSCVHSRAYGKGLTAATHQYADRVENMVRRRHQQPDIIHAHDWLTMEAGVRVKSATGSPLVVHVHATEYDRAGGHDGNPLIHDIELFGMQAADRIFAVSQITKDIIVQHYGIPADKIEVVHNSIDPSELPPIAAETNNYAYLRRMQSLGYKVVANIGRLTVQKGLSYLVEAAALAISKNPKLIFVISGSGELRDQLVELAADLGISDRVIFTGFVRGARFRELYEIADMFVMPSISEPFGLTPLEAAYYNTAILLSKTCGVGEILNNVMRFDYWDTRKLADQIVGISLSPALHSSLVQGVKSEYLRCNWGDVARKLLHQYDRVIATGGYRRAKRQKKEVTHRG